MTLGGADRREAKRAGPASPWALVSLRASSVSRLPEWPQVQGEAAPPRLRSRHPPCSPLCCRKPVPPRMGKEPQPARPAWHREVPGQRPARSLRHWQRRRPRSARLPVNLIGGLLIEHKRELGSEPSQTRAHLARLLGHRDEEKADQRRHRNQRRSKRNPKAASAIGRDK